MRRIYLLIIVLMTAVIMSACDEIVDDVIDMIANDSNNNEMDVEQEREAEPVDGELKIHFIDVGQGDSVLLRSNEATILVDAGDWNRKDAIEYISSQNIDKFDLIVGTHPHADHIGQLDTIISEYEVDEVWMSGDLATTQVFERVLTAIEESGANYNEPRAGESYTVGDIDIEILSPVEVTGSLNDGSIVMRIDYGEVSVLLTGDAENKAEQSMLDRGEPIEATIMKAGHHGSDTSNTEAFVNKVNPEVVVIQVGKDNKYNHPMKSVLDRFYNVNADVYANKDNGNVVITTDGKTYNVLVDKEGEVTPESDK